MGTFLEIPILYLENYVKYGIIKYRKILKGDLAMKESIRKNSEKLFLLKVCLPLVYQEIGDVGIEAVEQGWAKEQDIKFINDLVHKHVVKATEEAISYEGNLQEKSCLLKSFNYFLYAYMESKNPKTMEEVEDSIKEYYKNVESSVKLGG